MTTLDAGAIGEFAPRSATRFAVHRVIVVRDDVGVMAVSAVCTHAGCTVALRSHGLQCPCHGATFSMDGAVLGGPAKRPLPHFRVTVHAGRLYVHLAEHVPATERLIV